MSAANEAQDALDALLEADGAFAGVFLQLGIPFEIPRKNDRIYVSEDVVGYLRSRGGDFIQESFGLIVVIEVWRSGAPAGPAKARLWELVDAVDAALEAADFYGYSTEDGQLQAEVTMNAYENGRLLRATLTIPVTSLS